MTPVEYLALAGAGLVAGAVNTIAGAGSLLTYPVMVGLGLSPLAANVTNDVGIVPGNGAGALSLRKDLHGQGQLLRTVVPLTVVGSVLGAIVLLLAPARVFKIAAPVLLLLASLVTGAQPKLARLAQRGHEENRKWLRVATAAIGAYGGYFGTGIGVLFFAMLGVFVHDDARRLNATKTLLQLLANGVAGVIFAFVAPVHWAAAAVLAAGSTVGAPAGGKLSRYVPANGLRLAVCVIGVAASGYLFWQQA